jgi:hypothetical protein
MKVSFLLGFVMYFAGTACEVLADVAFETTKAVECIQMRVEFFPADRAPMSTGSRLALNFGCTTNRVVLLLPDHPFFAKISLLDSLGNEVEKTRFGREIGARFSESIEFSIDNTMKNPRGDPINWLATPDFLAGRNWRKGEKDMTIRDLFRIEKPGDYTFRIQARVFKRMAPMKYRLVDLPATDMPVRHPE